MKESGRLPYRSVGARNEARFGLCLSVAMAERNHPFPSRTRKLSSPAPMDLRGRPPGRVGRSRTCPFRKHAIPGIDIVGKSSCREDVSLVFHVGNVFLASEVVLNDQDLRAVPFHADTVQPLEVPSPAI